MTRPAPGTGFVIGALAGMVFWALVITGVNLLLNRTSPECPATHAKTPAAPCAS